MAKFIAFLIVAAGYIAGFAGISALVGWVFMLLFNYIAPNFGYHEISFKLAWAIWIMICLIGGIFRSSTSKG